MKLSKEIRAYMIENARKGGKKASETNKKKPGYYHELSKKGVLARQNKRKKLSTDGD